MYYRKDKKKLPIGVIPNGSGNDLAIVLSHGSPEKALDHIIKGDIVKVDLIKTIIDHEREEDIKEEDREKYVKYAVDLVNFGIAPKITESA